MENRTILQYLFAVSPLVLAQLLIPPLSYAIGERVDFPLLNEIYANVTPKQLFSWRFLRSLMWNPQDIKEDRFYTLISYMFVHADYNHLFNNLKSLLLVGFPTYQEFGSLGMYATFFGSGMIAVAPSSLRTAQSNNGKDNTPWKKLLNNFVTFVLPPRCCGSSSAVFGLFGGSQVIILYRLIKYIHFIKLKLRRERQTRHRWNISQSQSIIFKLLQEVDIKYTLISLIQITRAIITMKDQVDLVYNGGEGNLDLAGHIQGFLGGVVITTLFQCFKSSFFSSSSSPSSSISI